MTDVLKVDPRVDFVAKRIFSKQHLLLSLIRAVLEPDGVHVASIESLTTVDDRQIKDDKTIIFDAHVQLQDGSRSIIEIQLYVPNWTGDRVLYNWSRGFVKMLGIGENYKELQPLYSIWILGENLFKDDVPVHHFSVHDPRTGKVLSDKLQIYTIELKKGPDEDNIKTELERWMVFFQRGREYDPKRPPASLRTETFNEAFQIMIEITEEERAWATYEREQRYLRAEITRKQHEEELWTNFQKADAERRRAEAAFMQESIERKRAEAAHQQEVMERKRAEAAHQRAEDRIRELEAKLLNKDKQN